MELYTRDDTIENHIALCYSEEQIQRGYYSELLYRCEICGCIICDNCVYHRNDVMYIGNILKPAHNRKCCLSKICYYCARLWPRCESKGCKLGSRCYKCNMRGDVYITTSLYIRSIYIVGDHALCSFCLDDDIPSDQCCQLPKTIAEMRLQYIGIIHSQCPILDEPAVMYRCYDYTNVCGYVFTAGCILRYKGQWYQPHAGIMRLINDQNLLEDYYRSDLRRYLADVYQTMRRIIIIYYEHECIDILLIIARMYIEVDKKFIL